MGDVVPIPAQGRTFAESRRVRLTDVDQRGRLRLDAVARFLQEIAIDDVDETGWGAPQHLWFVRRMRVDVLKPILADRAIELVTWCSGLATVAAGRRWSLTGDRGGRIEVDSVWIYLAPDQRPARITHFDAYAEAAAGRPAHRRAALTLATPRLRRRPSRAREQHRLLAGDRARAPRRRPRAEASPARSRRLPRPARPRRPTRARRHRRRAPSRHRLRRRRPRKSRGRNQRQALTPPTPPMTATPAHERHAPGPLGVIGRDPGDRVRGRAASLGRRPRTDRPSRAEAVLPVQAPPRLHTYYTGPAGW